MQDHNKEIDQKHNDFENKVSEAIQEKNALQKLVTEAESCGFNAFSDMINRLYKTFHNKESNSLTED